MSLFDTKFCSETKIRNHYLGDQKNCKMKNVKTNNWLAKCFNYVTRILIKLSFFMMEPSIYCSFSELWGMKRDWGLVNHDTRAKCGPPSAFFKVFNWRIIALQGFVAFCYTSRRISHRYTHVPFLLDLPPISLPISIFSLSQSPCLSSLSHTENPH